MYQKKEKYILQKKWALICHSWILRWLIGIILGEIIYESSNWQHIPRLKITILGANWQLLRLERIAKCSYFILSTQNIKFYWFVKKIKKFMLPIWWYNRGLFPCGNKYLGSSFWMGKYMYYSLSNIGINTNRLMFIVCSWRDEVEWKVPPPPPPPPPPHTHTHTHTHILVMVLCGYPCFCL